MAGLDPVSDDIENQTRRGHAAIAGGGKWDGLVMVVCLET